MSSTSEPTSAPPESTVPETAAATEPASHEAPHDAHASDSTVETTRHGGHAPKMGLPALALATLGVVYGDIGTSPLYALRECFAGLHGIEPTPLNIYGVLSLIFWSLIVVISIKYIVFILRADNRGEGGILALTALATPIRPLLPSARRWIVLLGVFGAALLYGDGVITPAISVLSAVEGLEIATPAFVPFVIPITIVILIGLFLVQRRGTQTIGQLFGPVMLVWFATLAFLGVINIAGNPGVLAAINPIYAVEFFIADGWIGFLVLGTVFLSVTGGEALYADMGHFGRKPIQLAWFALVLPALLLNYFGQGALLLKNPEAAEHSFYYLAPEWALYPLVVLSTLATIIASQALISGAFSITMQAENLGFFPRMKIIHTSAAAYGQIYIPLINFALMIACILVVLGFRTSSNLAAAYGIAVTSTMAITTLIFAIVALDRWKWKLWQVILVAGTFLIIDLAFLGANMVKIPQGGWFPLVVAAILFTVMTTWKRGTRMVFARERETDMTLNQLTEKVRSHDLVRAPGEAVFLSADPTGVPAALLANLKYNGVLHEHVLLTTVHIRDVPHVAESHRVSVKDLGEGVYSVKIQFGFMEELNIPRALRMLEIPGIVIDHDHVPFFVNRTRVIASDLPGMALWRERLYTLMRHNATSAADFFCLPSSRVFEIGTSVEV